ncbi:hypothetical protein T12_16781 [Trichinella patagoniensis]|uniref:Uncharacterized protein n=1 Tax=Trichinella patagoniensis TaxID=990121 RepID=A0A0V0ZNK9_9BILA|nr:hypothetical protein T12_16781 [Trichinella patagoniensis]
MPRCKMLSVKTDSKTIGITSSAEFLWCSFCSGQRDNSCSHHFVLNFASQTSVSIEFAPDCSWIVQCLLVPFATRVRMDVKAFPSRPSVPLLITHSVVPFALDTVLSHVHIIGYVKCAHFIHDSITLTSSEFDLVPFATSVRMDVKSFPSRPSVPLLITHSVVPFALDTVLSHVHIIGYVKCAHFIHDSITLSSSEFDVSSDGPLS